MLYAASPVPPWRTLQRSCRAQLCTARSAQTAVEHTATKHHRPWIASGHYTAVVQSGVAHAGGQNAEAANAKAQPGLHITARDPAKCCVLSVMCQLPPLGGLQPGISTCMHMCTPTACGHAHAHGRVPAILPPSCRNLPVANGSCQDGLSVHG